MLMLGWYELNPNFFTAKLYNMEHLVLIDDNRHSVDDTSIDIQTLSISLWHMTEWTLFVVRAFDSRVSQADDVNKVIKSSRTTNFKFKCTTSDACLWKNSWTTTI